MISIDSLTLKTPITTPPPPVVKDEYRERVEKERERERVVVMKIILLYIQSL